MKYRLSLDLGVGSIGGAVLKLDEENNVIKIADCGVNIFEVSEGAAGRREKRQARKNCKRTKLRLNLLANALESAGLWTFDEFDQNELIKLSPYGIRAQAVNGKLNNIHELGRAVLHMAKHRGASFVSIQKVEIENQDEEEGKSKKKNKISEYAKLDHYIRETGAKTIGEYFFMRLHSSYKHSNLIKDLHKRYVRQRKKALPALVDYAIPRYLVKDEFEKIWDKQSQYYPQLKDPELKQKIYNILFYEKHHRPYAVGKCIFIRTEPRLPKSHPLSEQRRIYEAVNNITVQEVTTQRKLNISERDKIINELLMKGQKAGVQAIKSLLGFGKSTKIILSDNAIKPYLYSTEEFQSLEAFKNISEEKLADIVTFMAEPRLENGDDYLYNDEEVVEKLKEMLDTTDEAFIARLVAMVPKERSALGITATTAVLQFLREEVISLREATDKIALSDRRFISEEEKARALQGSYDKLPYYGEILQTDTQPIPEWLKKVNKSLNEDEKEHGKIANPGVHRILNQLRKFVNDIIRIYGKPYDINIELAREVGMSTKKKNEYENRQRQNLELNKEADNYLRKHHLALNKTNRLKYKLAKEQDWRDAFNPDINIGQKFEGMEIEHLIPRSVGGTDAPINRVLISRSDNLAKGNMYPYEYLQSAKSEILYKILEEVRKNTAMPEGKKWRFESTAREYFEAGDDQDNITRYLTDTRYVCKLAARYLKAIVDYKPGDANNTRVLTINGGHTAQLRKFWNLSGIEYEIMGLDKDVPKNLPCERYYYNKETGQSSSHYIEGSQWIEKSSKRNEEWKAKPRIDHRHHIVDAIVIGCLSRSNMQNINWHQRRELESPLEQIPVPFCDGDMPPSSQLNNFRHIIIDTLRDVKVSHKPERSKKRQLHEETPQAIVPRDTDDGSGTLTRYSRSIDNVLKSRKELNKLLIQDSIKDDWNPQIKIDKADMIALKEMILSRYDDAESILEEENRRLEREGKKAKNISEKTILTKAFSLIAGEKLPSGRKVKPKYPAYTNIKSAVSIAKHKVMYKSGRNYKMDFYVDEKGKIAWECINVFNANDKSFTPKSKADNCKPIWYLCVGDMVELDTPEQWFKYSNKSRCIAVVKKMRDVAIELKYHSDARGTTGSINNHIQDSSGEKGLSYWTKLNMQKIELTPFGKIGRKHKRLWDGKKETIK